MAGVILALRLGLAPFPWAVAPAPALAPGLVSAGRNFSIAATIGSWEATIACHMHPQDMAIQRNPI